MNAITIEIPDDIAEELERLTALKGVTRERLLADAVAEMAHQAEAYELFRQMSERGRGRETEALALLRR